MSTAPWPPAFSDVLRPHLPLLGSAPLAASTNLNDSGLDSLGTISLLVDLEDALAVSFPDELLHPDTFRTVGTLWAALDGLVVKAS